MVINEAVERFKEKQKDRLRPMTKASYEYLLNALSSEFKKKSFQSIKPDDVLAFLSKITEGQKSGTKKLRYNQLKAFFNFCIREFGLSISNPCTAQELKEAFKAEESPKKPVDTRSIEKVLSLPKSERDTLIIDLMARAGLEASDVLSLKPSHLRGRKVLFEPGRIAYLPKRLAKEINAYIRKHKIASDQPVFKLSYPGLRIIVRRYGEMVGAALTPNELRKYAGLAAYNKGIPIEFISKVIYRHESLDTTMDYLRLSYQPKNQKEIYEWMDRLDS